MSRHARRTAAPRFVPYVWLAVIAALAVAWVLYDRGGRTPDVSVSQPVSVPVNVYPPSVAPVPTPTVTATSRAPVPRAESVPVPAPRTVTVRPTPSRPSVGCLPGFPGAVYPGQQGARVLAWQRILVAAGVIHGDRPSNLDGWYGPGMTAKVNELQAGWGWSPVPGYAGPRTYRKLEEVSCR